LAAKKTDAGAEGNAQPVSDGAVKKKVSMVKILILLIIALVVLGAIVVGGLYVLTGVNSPETEEAQAEPTEESSSSEESSPTLSKEISTLELKPFVVNLADKGTYLKITIALGYGAIENEQLLQDKMTNVRDCILTVLSSKSEKTLSTKHGKMKLKEDIKKSLGQLTSIEGVVTSVYFTDFQIL